MKKRIFLLTAYALSLMSNPATAVTDVKSWVTLNFSPDSWPRKRSVLGSRNNEGAELDISTVLQNKSNHIFSPRENGITNIQLIRTNAPDNESAFNRLGV